MPTPEDYLDLSSQELRVRLAAAEAVCVLFGWSATTDTIGGKATSQAWMEWAHLVGDDFTGPQRHPDPRQVTPST